MQLVVDNLTVSRGERRVLAGLSLTVSPGEGLLLTGPNGVGGVSAARRGIGAAGGG
jgi:heme exporter protein A